MQLIKLKNSDKSAVVDDEDFERLIKFNWFLSGLGTGIRRNAVLNGKKRSTSMASEIMNMPDKMFDHINRDPFDNRKSNLRAATYKQNGANKVKRAGCSSIYKGVSKAKDKWYACIRFNYKTKSLGFYNTEVAAAKAYDDAARRMQGAFAVLNFP